MRRTVTLIAVREWDGNVLEIELMHRPWWRRIPFLHRPRTEVLRCVGLDNLLKEMNR